MCGTSERKKSCEFAIFLARILSPPRSSIVAGSITLIPPADALLVASPVRTSQWSHPCCGPWEDGSPLECGWRVLQIHILDGEGEVDGFGEPALRCGFQGVRECRSDLVLHLGSPLRFTKRDRLSRGPCSASVIRISNPTLLCQCARGHPWPTSRPPSPALRRRFR